MTVLDSHAATMRRGRAVRQAERLARAMDHLPYLTRHLPPVEVVSTEGLEAIEHNADTLLLDNGPGQHFLGAPHTLANFEDAFWRSQLSDNGSFEQWEMEGARDAAARANERWKRQLAEYVEPALDERVHEELRAWIDVRRASFPDSEV